uniref:Uncharacterized protein n=1 Tax=Gopherus evgoodei TaxID=1825980 RepID=A0A8C4YKN9_9SAUR
MYHKISGSLAFLFSVPRSINAEIATGLLWFTDRQKLTEWAKEVKIDPNDPEYSDLMEFIMYARSKEQTVSKYFRLEQLQEEFNFVTEEEIKKCKRFQLLQLRNSEQLDFCHFRQIPLYDREIPDAVIQVFLFISFDIFNDFSMFSLSACSHKINSWLHLHFLQLNISGNTARGKSCTTFHLLCLPS